MKRKPSLTAVCRFCRRSRPLGKLVHYHAIDGYQCVDEVSCSEATQWAEGGTDGQ